MLLAPSWGSSSILNKYGARMSDALLGTGYHLIIRPHPQSYTSESEMLEALMARYPQSDRLEWNRDNDNFDVLNRSDILISDFSGVMFDFSLVFDKPIIYADTSFDKGIYDACWLDEEMWTFDILPAIGQQLTEDGIDDIKQVIDACLTDPKYAAGRDRARSEAWAHPGEATVRTVDYLIAKYRELNPEDEEVREK
ncbi:MAG: CDP-glycerol glycerophosphotransferase family protein [Lachnospiraceae bacterium]|nr:CDP-glycerol glycerophosphotransferase family protein [Lachnospiraceae bacterium]